MGAFKSECVRRSLLIMRWEFLQPLYEHHTPNGAISVLFHIFTYINLKKKLPIGARDNSWLSLSSCDAPQCWRLNSCQSRLGEKQKKKKKCLKSHSHFLNSLSSSVFFGGVLKGSWWIVEPDWNCSRLERCKINVPRSHNYNLGEIIISRLARFALHMQDLHGALCLC